MDDYAALIMKSRSAVIMGRKNGKEVIHSGQFMVSDIEAEAQDEENVLLEVPIEDSIQGLSEDNSQDCVIIYGKRSNDKKNTTATLSIDGSLTKLFRTMSLAYRHKITSPKWNGFKGLKLRWKDKIRLNNLIWRCWHLQFILRKGTSFCQFAPDVDIHNRPEAILLEGKYWKRQAQAICAEYKKWRLYYKHRISGHESPLDQEMTFLGLEEMDWARSLLGNQGIWLESDHSDMDFTDMLFSPHYPPSQPFPFPNPREIARGTGNSDLQQPGLVQLQPDLSDDDVVSFQEMLAGRGLALPPLPEEELFPEAYVGDLPPSPHSSITTPVPQTVGYTARVTATHVYEGGSLGYTGSRTDVPTHILPVHASGTPSDYYGLQNNTQCALPQPMEESCVPLAHYTSHQHSNSVAQSQPFTVRPPTRSQSQQEISISQGQDASNGSAFAVPKSLPRRRSHSGTVSSAPAGSPPQQVLSAISTPILPCATSPRSPALPQTSPGLPGIANSAPSSQIYPTPASSSSSINIPTSTMLVASIIPSDSLSSCSNSSLSKSSSSNPLKVSLVIPGIVPASDFPVSSVYSITDGHNSIQTSSSCGSTGMNTASHSTILPKKKLAPVPPLLLPNITLSAVTPSSLKSVPFTQVTSWTPASAESSSFVVKASPPYSDPASPHYSQSSGIPSPSSKPLRPKTEQDRTQYKEHRRVSHINAEQRRRCSIKSNFDILHSLIPSIHQNPNAKISKAGMLHKGVEYIQQLKMERMLLTEQAEHLRAEIDRLNQDISVAQSQLPATGAPVSQSKHSKMKKMFEDYVREQSLTNWKFWVFSLVTEPLLDSFSNSVSTASIEDLCKTSVSWLDQHCSLNVLRPVVSNAMRKLSTSTNILSHPEKLPQDIYNHIRKQESKCDFSGHPR